MLKKDTYSKIFQAADGRTKTVTIVKLTGEQPGPTLTLIAGQHGMEHIGPVVLQRFLANPPENFKGTIYVCPCANPFALELDFEWYPEQEGLEPLKDYYYSRFRHDYCPYGIGRKTYSNMNRVWNQRHQPQLNITAEIAAWLWDTTCTAADLIIDFHCRNAEQPLIFARNLDIVLYARYFGSPYLQATPSQATPEDFEGGTLVIQAVKHGINAYCLEFSMQHGYRYAEIPFGLTGIANTMKGLGMLEGEVVLERPLYALKERHPVVAETTGHIHYFYEPYEAVAAGDVLFEVHDIETLEVTSRGVAPVEGVMSERSYHPIARPGLVPCYVLRVEEVAPAGVPLPVMRVSRV